MFTFLVTLYKKGSRSTSNVNPITNNTCQYLTCHDWISKKEKYFKCLLITKCMKLK